MNSPSAARSLVTFLTAEAGPGPWVAAALAVAPCALVLLLQLLWHPPGLWPTGLFDWDQAAYAAMARATLAEGTGLAFAWPFSTDPERLAAYSTPLFLLHGQLLAAGFDPGRSNLLLGLLFALGAARLLHALHRRAVPERDAAALASYLLLLQGGGLFFLGGAVKALLTDDYSVATLTGHYAAVGSWALNVGRNLLTMTESCYHLLAFALFLLLLRQRWRAALALAALLAWTHPFTAVVCLLALLAFALLERGFLARPLPPRWFAPALLLLLALLLGYHWVLLPRLVPEHRSLMQAWAQPWGLDALDMLAAWGLVAPFALWRLRSLAVARATLAATDARFFLLLFLCVFLLANHEAFLPPHQPIHFDKGHAWFALYLLGAPALAALLRRLLAARRLAHGALLLALCGLFLADNLLSYARQIYGNARTETAALLLTPAERAALARLADPALAGRLLIAEDPALAFLAKVYTPLDAWSAQPYYTPFYAERRAALEAWRSAGAIAPAWQGRALVFAVAGDATAARARPWFMAGDSILAADEGVTLVLRN